MSTGAEYVPTTVLEDYMATIASFPSDLQQTLNELRSKDEEYVALRSEIERTQTDFYGKLEDIVRAQVRPGRSGAFPSHLPGVLVGTPPAFSGARSSSASAATRDAETKQRELLRDFPGQLDLYQQINADFGRCQALADDKVRIAERSKELIDRYLRRLSEDLDRISPAFDDEPAGSASASPALSTPISRIRESRMTPSSYRSSALRAKHPDLAEYDPSESRLSALKRKSITPKRLIKRKTFGDLAARNSAASNGHHPAATGYPPPSAMSTPMSHASTQPASPRMRAASPDTTDDLLYCLCQQVSFGEMIACDNPQCPHEWFHLGCVGLAGPPAGAWMCPTCVQTGALTPGLTSDCMDSDSAIPVLAAAADRSSHHARKKTRVI
ncbi:hypothetical protein BDZ88DRAFT_448279 [Geranomyces variabilis]|nr:hypothetical protein BDZ88DRAFT_448279 [Geranomyces variabilis]